MRFIGYKVFVSQIVTRYWALVLIAWVFIALGLISIAPSWSSIAADGDLAFLPASVPSAVGQRALEQAFPGASARSQVVLVFANRSEPLTASELAFAMDVTRRLHWYTAQSQQENLLSGSARSKDARAVEVTQEIVRDNVTEVIDIGESVSAYLSRSKEALPFRRMAEALRFRAALPPSQVTDGPSSSESNAAEVDDTELDLATAAAIDEKAAGLQLELPDWSVSLRDVWSWRSTIVGSKLGSDLPNARLVAIQLDTDFSATANIDVVAGIESMVRTMRLEYAGFLSDQFECELSGSAAVGADMLRAAVSGVRMTETVTIILVLGILSAVYRAPLLIAIPIASIGLSLIVSTSVIALLARDPLDATSAGLGVFTTTRIFIVVLLFGAGTDFCLFFLARNRELLEQSEPTTRRKSQRQIARGWRSVHNAIVTSGLTTIIGLALMWFSEFEKFKFSGPIIAISLAITLLVCLTFTPALLTALGKTAYWPQLRGARRVVTGVKRNSQNSTLAELYWGRLASLVVRYPGMSLLLTLCILAVPAGFGVTCLSKVTYDLTEELSERSPSRRGANLIGNFFSTYESAPITIVLTRAAPFESEQQLRAACEELSTPLYTAGVESVRGLTDPLGDYPPGKRMGLFSQDAWMRRVLQGHRITKERYVSSRETMALRVARFDVVLDVNPFTLEAAATLDRVREQLQASIAEPTSSWHGAEPSFSGTTVGIADLRRITQADQRWIQVLVTVGVWCVLLVLLRKPLLSSYLLFTVLLSYFATLGLTYWLFSTIYAGQYSGLDWKVPLFLFVILVAVGQDYNVYLVTRVFEEQVKHPMPGAVRIAVEKTGGIITSCGFVMAGTFIAMTSPAVALWFAPWFPLGWIDVNSPVLRGITELGFALAFGVLLDTLIVRSILVPAFMVLTHRGDRNADL